MSNEIEGLRQAGAIKSKETCEDSLPSWDGRRATKVIDGLWVNTTKRGPDGEVIRCKKQGTRKQKNAAGRYSLK